MTGASNDRADAGAARAKRFHDVTTEESRGSSDQRFFDHRLYSRDSAHRANFLYLGGVDARVLVVEDNDLVSRAFQMLIEHYAAVVLATNAATARRAIGSGDFTAIVLDIRLPDGSGLDVLQHARTSGYEGPALIYSGNHEPSELNRAFALQAEYLVKPASAEALVSFVKRAVERRTTRAWVESWATRYALTPSERMILVAAAEGQSRSEIDAQQSTAVTAKTHVHNLLAKTGDSSLLAAVARALRERAS